MKNRLTIFTTALSVLACFAFLPQMQAELGPEVPGEPDGCYTNFVTAEGCDALNGPGSITLGLGNTALGWRSLFFGGPSFWNTGTGAGTLAINTGNENTATGAGALLINLGAFGNTANGAFALFQNLTGANNTAVGDEALFNNDITANGSANDNTAVGAGALFSNTDGNRNCAVGSGALFSNQVAGNASNAFGFEALFNNDSDGADLGLFNNGFGWEALFSNVDGIWNTAMGDFAGGDITGNHNSAFGADALSECFGDDNVGVGFFAGSTAGASSNTIFIGANAGTAVTWDTTNIISIGVTNDSSVFGTAANTCYINYIYNEPAPAGVPLPVFVDSDNVVGSPVSSRRYKHDVKPMDKASETIFALKPVTFKYNGNKTTPFFGLIAEDVAEVSPDLVAFDKKGQPNAVRYDQIDAMLLNEFLKEHKKVEAQQASIAELKSTVGVLTAQLKEQAAQIQKVSAQIEVNKPAPQVVANKP